jgi:hypothetical protein
LTLSEHPLFQQLARLELPIAHFVIAGSGPMLAYGLRDHIHDLDIVARKDAWDRAVSMGEAVPAPYAGARIVYLCDSAIEVIDRWFQWDADELIKSAEFIESLPFVPLRITLEWKRELNRPSDRHDIQVLERVLR